MIINPVRISKLLQSQGFYLWRADQDAGEVRFSRVGLADGIFEHIWISAYGEAGNTVGSYSVVSVTAGPDCARGLYIESYHDDLCSERREFIDAKGEVHKDYFTHLEYLDEAIIWEQHLASYAPLNVRKLANEV